MVSSISPRGVPGPAGFQQLCAKAVDNYSGSRKFRRLFAYSRVCTARSSPISFSAGPAPLRYAGAVKIRIDKLLVARGLAATRARAQALILAGKVLVNEQKIEKSGVLVPENAAIRLLGEDLRYVSRGGVKLEAALHHWLLDVRHRICLDIGASTGGFTDCLLQHGAARVVAVDTGYGQLDFRLRQDPRVRLLEKTNARYLTRAEVAEAVEFIAMDVSFISATLVLPAVIAAAFPDRSAGTMASPPEAASASDLQGSVPLGSPPAVAQHPFAAPMRELVVLVKPQFEAGREYVESGGIVHDPAAHQAAIDKVRHCVLELGASAIDVIESPITGAEGNREFLLRACFAGDRP